MVIARLRKRFKGMTVKTWWNILAYNTVLYRHPVWYNVLNKKASRMYRKDKPQLTPVEQEIVNTLKRDGIAIVPIEKLLGKEALPKLVAAMKKHVQENKELINFMESGEANIRKGDYKQIERLKKVYNLDHDINYEKFKFFNVRLMGEKKLSVSGDRAVVADLKEPFIDFMLNDKVLNIVNGYMGMYTRVNYANLWYNIPVPKTAELRLSQKWHRDPGDLKALKVFVYAADVTADMGPLHYVPGSQFGGKYETTFRRPMPYGKYPPHEAVNERFKNEIKVCTGKAGTVVFVDTLGLHRGGFSNTDPRIVYAGMWISDASIEGFSVKQDPKADYSKLSKQARYALKLE